MAIAFLLLFYFLFSKPSYAQTPVTNPDSGIFLSEFMADVTSPDKEWVEIYNQNNIDVILDGWKIKDSIETTKSLNVSIGANSFYVLEFTSGYLNNNGDTINLVDNTGSVVDSYTYTSSDKTSSWSKQSDNSWCQTNLSKGSLNSICLSIATNTSVPASPPSPTNTFTPTPTSPPQSSITLNSAPSSISPGQTFSIQFTLSNITPNQDYRLKVVYGTGTDASKTCMVKTVATDGTILHYSGDSWDLFPVFKSDNTSLNTSINAVLSDCTNYSLDSSVPIKIKSEDGLLSENLKQISINLPSTSTPTSTPYPTSTPKTTSTPTPTVSPTVTDTPTDTPSPVPQVLGNTNQTQDIPDIYKFEDPKSASSSAKFTLTSYAPYFLIIVGGGLLLAPAIFSKFS